jgi:hypothetical protein
METFRSLIFLLYSFLTVCGVLYDLKNVKIADFFLIGQFMPILAIFYEFLKSRFESW